MAAALRCLLVCLTLLLVVVLPGCGSDDDQDGLPSGTAAVVGPVEISEAAVDRELDTVYATQGGNAKSFGPPRYTVCLAKYREFPEAPGRVAGSDHPVDEIRKRCETEYRIQRTQAVGRLVRARWLEFEAKRQRVEGLEEAVRERMGSERASAERVGETYAEFLRSGGLTEASATERIRAEMRQAALMKRIRISDEAIRRYGRENADVYLT